MATNINKKDRLLGFDDDTFEMVIRKPKEGSVWIESELKAGKSVQSSIWKDKEAPEAVSKRMKTTIEAFLDSSYDVLILVGKVVKENK